MKLVLKNSKAFASEFANDGEKDFLREALTLETQEWNPFMRCFRPVRQCLLSVANASLPIGLAPATIQLMRQHGHAVQVVNERERPGGEPNLAVLDDLARTLRPFQRGAIERALAQRIGVVKAPVGSGKTLIAVGIMAAKQDIRWVVFCPKDTLVDQMAAEYELNLCEKPGIIKKGVWRPGRVTIVTFSQCRARKEELQPILEEAGGFIIDEVHSAGGATHLDAVLGCTNAHYRIGLSATPLDRSDKKNILVVAASGPMIYEVSTQELLDAGLVSKPVIRMIRFLHEEGGPADRLQETQAIYRARVVNNRARNDLLHAIIRRAGKPCMVFVLRNEHVKDVYDMVQKAGEYTVSSVDQRAHPERRKEVIARMRAGELEVCIASQVFQDGVNVPELASVVVATGYKSTIATLQRLGRGARRTDTKNEFELWDIADGGVWGDRHTDARCKAYQREEYEVRIVSWDQVLAGDV